jgi:MFS family permease
MIFLSRQNKKTMDESIKEGAAYSVMFGFGESYISPFAIFLKATAIQLGLLNSIPQLVSSFAQLFTSKVTKKVGNRKSVLSLSVLLQAISWLPILFLFLFPKNNILYLIFFFALYMIFGTFGTSNWRSIMDDVVPDKTKGSYFGKRNKVISLVSFISLITAGLILQFFSFSNPLTGFLIIFSIAMVARFISWSFIDKMHDPKEEKLEDDKTTFKDFLKNLWKSNPGLFVIYSCLLFFSVRIAGPFFDPYMLNDLGLSYTQYIMIKASAVFSTFIFMPIWGKYSDIFGNKRVLTVTGFFVSCLPILWVFSTSVFYLMVVQIFSGLMWSGFNLSSFNFFYDALPKDKVLKYTSFFNVLLGFSVFFGALFGGYIVKLGGMFLSNFYIVFILSGVMRFLSWLIFLPRVSENRYVKETTEARLLWTVTGDVFGNVTQPLIQLIDRRSTIKYRTEVLLKWIRKQIRKMMGKRYS